MTDEPRIVVIDLAGGEGAMHLATEIGKCLHALPPELIGAVLGLLLSRWLCGFPPQDREEMKKGVLTLAQNLIEPTDAELYGAAGHPGANLQ